MANPDAIPALVEAVARAIEQRKRVHDMRVCEGKPDPNYVNDLARAAIAALPDASRVAEAREAFLDMIADARDWHDEPDGDETGDHTTLHLITHHRQMERLIVALGISPPRYCETVADAINCALDRAPPTLGHPHG